MFSTMNQKQNDRNKSSNKKLTKRSLIMKNDFNLNNTLYEKSQDIIGTDQKFVTGHQISTGFQPNIEKINQDSQNFIIDRAGDELYQLFSVGDGHGIGGEDISQQCVKQLAELLRNNPSSFQFNLRNLLQEKHEELQSDLIQKSSMDCTLSGTTLCSVLIHKGVIYCCNTGNSRAILVSKDRFWSILNLSRDHVPLDEEEFNRITQAGGQIQKITDLEGNEIGPYRVFAKGEEFPALAISRMFGDVIAHKIGCTSVPDIQDRKLSSKDKMIVLGSDGLFQFLDQQVMVTELQRQQELRQPSLGASRMVELARREWRKNENIIDDITCVLIFFYEDNVDQ